MEGEGPGSGDPVEWRVALAGTDPLAVDVMTAHLMGFAPDRIGYLEYCRRLGLGVGELDAIQVVGNARTEDVWRAFAPHPAYRRQLEWGMGGVERYLKRDA
jgi:uncharacterized protein (DUF362 family)